MAGQSQAANLGGMLSQIGESLGGMGGAGDGLLGSIKNTFRPGVDPNDPESLQRQAAFQGRIGDVDQQKLYAAQAMALDEKRSEAQAAAQAAQEAKIKAALGNLQIKRNEALRLGQNEKAQALEAQIGALGQQYSVDPSAYMRQDDPTALQGKRYVKLNDTTLFDQFTGDPVKVVDGVPEPVKLSADMIRILEENGTLTPRQSLEAAQTGKLPKGVLEDYDKRKAIADEFAYSDALGRHEQIMGTLEEMKELTDDTSALGRFAFKYIPGTDEATLQSHAEMIQSDQFLQNVELMRGTGALSDAEGKRLEVLRGELNTGLSGEALKKRIEEYMTIYRTAWDREDRNSPNRKTLSSGKVVYRDPRTGKDIILSGGK